MTSSIEHISVQEALPVLDSFLLDWSEEKGALFDIKIKEEVYELLLELSKRNRLPENLPQLFPFLSPLLCKYPEQHHQLQDFFFNWGWANRIGKYQEKRKNEEVSIEASRKKTEEPYDTTIVNDLLPLVMVILGVAAITFYVASLISPPSQPEIRLSISNIQIEDTGGIQTTPVALYASGIDSVTGISLRIWYAPEGLDFRKFILPDNQSFLPAPETDSPETGVLSFDWAAEGSNFLNIRDNTVLFKMAFLPRADTTGIWDIKFDPSACFVDKMVDGKLERFGMDNENVKGKPDGYRLSLDKGHIHVASRNNNELPVLKILLTVLSINLILFILLYFAPQAASSLYLKRRFPTTGEQFHLSELFPPSRRHSRDMESYLADIALPGHRDEGARMGLDVERTVRKTAAYAGMFSPVFVHQKRFPAYLILIDQWSQEDQLAAYAALLVELLQEDMAETEIYFFDKDPRYCYSSKDGTRASLDHLAGRYPTYVLLVFSGLEGVRNPFTGELEPWAFSAFSEWKKKALFSPEYLKKTHSKYQLLSQVGFSVYPFSAESIRSMKLHTASQARLLEAPDVVSNFLPALLRGNTIIWMGTMPPPEELVSQLLSELELFLGHYGMMWLSACAVFPQVNLRLTMYLGYRLAFEETGKPLFRSATLLMRLAQLPWFRQGYMPDWLRLLLISLLEPKQEQQVREAISSFFREGLDQNIGKDPITIAIPKTRKIAPLIPGLLKEVEKELEEDSPLREYIFAGFLKYGKLAVKVHGLGNPIKRKFMPMPFGVLLAILLFSFFTVGIFSILMMMDIIGEIFQTLRASGSTPSYRKAKDVSSNQLPRPKITVDVFLAIALLSLFSWGAYLVLFILEEWAAKRAMKRERIKR